EFIGIAEETGSLEHMDWQIYERVCQDVPRLGRGPVYTTLNVSPRHLRAPGFDQRLLELMARHEVKPASVRLEVTEGALLDQPAPVPAGHGRLHDAGVQPLYEPHCTTLSQPC